MSTKILSLPDELYIIIFKFVSSPKDFKNLAICCNKFSIRSKDSQTRAEWIIYQYGKAHALFHAIRLGPTFINLSVAKAIIAKGGILSRYFIQRLFTHFGSYDKKLVDMNTTLDATGQINITKTVNLRARISWASNLQISIFSYLISEAQEQLKIDNLWVKGDDMELFIRLSGGEDVINHAQDILLQNMELIQKLILHMKFIPFPQRTNQIQDDSDEYLAKDGYENNRQLNMIVRSILICKDLVHLWRKIGYYEICEDLNDLVMKGALLLLFPERPFAGWTRPSLQIVKKRLLELIEVGFQLNYNVINYALHYFEHRLDDIGNILLESFMHIYVKPLALSSKFYNWVLRRFGPDEQITAHCFDDLLKTRISLETQRQRSNVKDLTGVNECAFKDICDTFKTYCKAKNFLRPSHLETISQSTSNEILALFFDHYLTSLFNAKMAFSLPMQTIGDPDSSQYSFKKSLTKGKHNVQKVQEWKEKLTSMYQQLMHEENKVTSIFRDYLNKFVEEKLLQSKEK